MNSTRYAFSTVMFLVMGGIFLSNCAPQRHSDSFAGDVQGVIETAESWEKFDDRFAAEGGFITFAHNDGKTSSCGSSLEFLTDEYPIEALVWTSSVCFQKTGFDFNEIKTVGLRVAHQGGYLDGIETEFRISKARDSFVAAFGDSAPTGMDSIFGSIIQSAPSSFAADSISKIEKYPGHADAHLLLKLWPPASGQNPLSSFPGFSDERWDICATQPEYERIAGLGGMVSCATVADIVALRVTIARPESTATAEVLQQKVLNQQMRVDGFLSSLQPNVRSNLVSWAATLREMATMWEEEAYARFLDCNSPTIASSATTTCQNWESASYDDSLVSALAGLARYPEIYQIDSTEVREGVGPHHLAALRRYLDLLADLQNKWPDMQNNLIDGGLSLVTQGNFGFAREGGMLYPKPQGFYAIPLAEFYKKDRNFSVDVLSGAIRVVSNPATDGFELLRSDSGSLFSINGVVPVSVLILVDRMPLDEGLSISDIPEPCQHLTGSMGGEVGCEADRLNARDIEGVLGGKPVVSNPVTREVNPLLLLAPGHGCLLERDGNVRCWGENSFGQAKAPEHASGGFIHLSVGARSSCGVTRTGDVKCWGNPSEYPRRGVTGAKMVASGNDFACALLESGSIACWGAGNSDGKREPPTSDLGYSSIALGLEFGCAVENGSNALFCWGATENLADLPTTDIHQVVAGNTSACVITKDKKAHCGKMLPAFTDLDGVQEIAVGDNAACVILADRETVCRSINEQGTGAGGEFRLGADLGIEQVALARPLGSPSEHPSTVCYRGKNQPLQCDRMYHDDMVPGKFFLPHSELVRGATSFASGGTGACALRDKQIIGCWGWNEDGESVPPQDLGKLKSLAIGLNNVCGIEVDGQVRCWGTTETPRGPSQQEVLTQLSGSLNSSCGITQETGSAFCFGSPFGVDGVFIRDSSEQKLSGLVRIVASRHAYCGVFHNGAVNCWRGDVQESAFSSPFDGSSPENKVKDITLWVASRESADAGVYGCAITEAGSIRCWNVLSMQTAVVAPELLAISDAEKIVAVNYSAIDEQKICVLTAAKKVRCTEVFLENKAVYENLTNVEQIFYDYPADRVCAFAPQNGLVCWIDEQKFYNDFFPTSL